jgi:drug/metabolite transporter (DMT)-like permease
MEYGIRERVVIFDAAFEAILGVVLVLGAALGQLGEDQYAAPASNVVLAIFGLALLGFAVLLATIVSRNAVTDTVLKTLAAVNAGFAIVLLVWVLVADGFKTAGSAVVWVTIVALLLLALMQRQAVGLRPTPRPPPAQPL